MKTTELWKLGAKYSQSAKASMLIELLIEKSKVEEQLAQKIKHIQDDAEEALRNLEKGWLTNSSGIFQNTASIEVLNGQHHSTVQSLKMVYNTLEEPLNEEIETFVQAAFNGN